MSYLFTSESVSEGHPDKVADQISDAILDEFLKRDPESKVACEVLVTKGLVVVSGEVTSNTENHPVNIEHVVRNTIKKIGYDSPEFNFDHESCEMLISVHPQSPDIKQGVVRKDKASQGAGDQGMMFGYACDEMENHMPLVVEISQRLVQELAWIRRNTNLMPYLRPDSKSQVTLEYENELPMRVDTIVLSTQHDEFVKPEDMSDGANERAQLAMQKKITEDIKKHLIPRVRESLPLHWQPLLSDEAIHHDKIRFLINPTGKFVEGGPASDTGLTGRKIIVDTYGGVCPHGGGAFSGKDPSKVDRSGAYAMRHIAKNLVAAGVASKVMVQVAYAIGKAEPVSIFIDTFRTCKAKDEKGQVIKDDQIAAIVGEIFDLTPYGMIKRMNLQDPIYGPTAAYGHFGREIPDAEIEVFYSSNDGRNIHKNVDGSKKTFRHVAFFTWEKTDYVEKIKARFRL